LPAFDWKIAVFTAILWAKKAAVWMPRKGLKRKYLCAPKGYTRLERKARFPALFSKSAGNAPNNFYAFILICGQEDLNFHASRHQHLKLAFLFIWFYHTLYGIFGVSVRGGGYDNPAICF
jgi:hypothetical protein